MRLKLLLSFFSLALFAGVSPARETKIHQGVHLALESVDIEVRFYTPSCVRVVKSPVGSEFQKESLSVIAKQEPVEIKKQEKGGFLYLKSNAIQVSIDLKSETVSFFTANGSPLLKEKNRAVFTDFNDAGVQTYSVFQPFLLDKDEAIYGLGQLQNGKMSQRGTEKRLIQGNTEDVVTFFQSVKGYGLFWDNYSPTTFADTPQETSFNSEVGDCVDYYFMYGGDADGVIAQMRTLTGSVPMFPLWTYGYWQSKERYKSQNEIVGVVGKYRDLGVPLDGIIQDWQYWGSNYLWNAMDFLNADFYDPKKMLEDTHNMNARMIISIWSSFGPMTKQYREMDANGMLFDFITWPEAGPDKWPPMSEDYPSGVRVYDAYNPAARDIYWKYLNDNILSVGMDGWWMDSTEPDHFHWKPEDWDTQTHLGSFRKVRNAYPLMTVGGVYDNQRAVTSDKRVFILTRSAFAGQQRYGANTWTGDVQATWADFARQVPAGLNFSLCGIPHWNSDIGGFFLWEYPRKLEDPDYRELYARWLQFGAFCPMMRSHGADAPREIWQFGKKGDKVYDAIEKFINLRYSLLPYIYSTSWEVSSRHSSMIRALFMDFAADRNVWDINDQYMFGKSFLVCPVTTPMYTEVVSGEGKDADRVENFNTTGNQEVYLPKGSDWYDFWTNEKMPGGRTILKETPIDIMPLYVRAGSVIPVGPSVQYAGEKKWDNLQIYVYAGANGSFTLYEDEFDNYNYEQGKYSEIEFTWNDSSRVLTIGDRRGGYDGMLPGRNFQIVLIEPGKTHAPKIVTYAGLKSRVKL